MVKLNEKDASIPARAIDGSAGYDLFSCETTTIPPMEQRIINLGFAMQLPDGTHGRIAPRSSMTLNHKITVMAGVIDPDYTGDVKVILYNYGTEPFEIIPRQKVAQLVLERFETPDI